MQAPGPLLALTILANFTIAHASGPPIRFTDQTRNSGIDLETVNGGLPKRTIVESTGSGAAFLDADGDGRLDLFVANGSTIDRLARGLPGAGARFYRGHGDGTFEDCTAESGLGDGGWAGAAVVADADNDGHPDLLVTGWGGNHYYQNHGDGTFSEVSEANGTRLGGYPTGAAFGDLDVDGVLDLYVARYVDLRLDPPPPYPCTWKGLEVFCGPIGLAPAHDTILRGGADGVFRDVTAALGLAGKLRAYGFTPLFLDDNQDRRPDVYVANDTQANFLLRNQPDGTMKDVAMLAGVAYNADGRAQAGMGVDSQDVDGDGHADIFVTNFSHDGNTLYLGSGRGDFSDRSAACGLVEPSLLLLGWAAHLADLDNDGDLDLLIANGHVYPEVDASGLGTTYAEPGQVFRNEGNARFRDVTRASGDFQKPRHARSMALGDYDNDGDLDVAMTQIDGPLVLLRNDTEGGRWIRLRLIGRESNRDAIGALVRVRVGGREITRYHRLQAGYLGSNDPRMLIGIGDAATVDEVTVEWPRGAVETWRGLEPLREHALVEGSASGADAAE